MGPRHPLALSLVLAGLAAVAAADDPPASEPPAAIPGGPQPAPAPAAAGVLTTVDGVIRAVDLAAHRVTLEVNGAPVILGLDRNTLVYLPTGLSTVFELRPGEVVRAGRNDRFVAFWVQVRSAPTGAGATPSAPDPGVGAGGPAPVPPERSGSPPSPSPGGSVPAPSSPGPG